MSSNKPYASRATDAIITALALAAAGAILAPVVLVAAFPFVG